MAESTKGNVVDSSLGSILLCVACNTACRTPYTIANARKVMAKAGDIVGMLMSWDAARATDSLIRLGRPCPCEYRLRQVSLG